MASSAWRTNLDAAAALRQRQAGATLHRYLLELFAARLLTAKDFSIIMHLCSEAGIRGGDFAPYGLPMDQPSGGRYQRRIDDVIPPCDLLYYITVPCASRRASTRTSMSLPVNPLHECIAKEIEQDPSLLSRAASTTWPACYYRNPVVRRAQQEGCPLPLPLVLYLDGVRYSSMISGRADSILAIWAYSAVTFRRHLLCTFRHENSCRCGCKGWCSMFPQLQAIRWSLDSLASGTRPLARHDGTPFAAGDPLLLKRASNASLGFSAMVMWVKGDWAEASASLGLASVNTFNAPCPYCPAAKLDLHRSYESMVWPRRQATYEDTCASHERVVVVATEADRKLIVDGLDFLKGDKNRGRQLKHNVAVAGVALLKGDSIEPTRLLPDVMAIDTAPLPTTVCFWRVRYDIRRRARGSVMRRNPMFCDRLGTTPSIVLQVDVLHSLNFGLMERVTSASIWRIILSNPWGLRGADSRIRDQAIGLLRGNMLAWFSANVASDRRIGDLTEKMLGDRKECSTDGNIVHPGACLKLKAAEMHSFMLWVTELLRSPLGDKAAYRDDLLAVLDALERWINVSKHADMVLSLAQSQALRDECQRALLHARRAMVSFTVKAHMLAEMSERAAHYGNPRFHACWHDESLNLTLRQIVSSCHKATQYERVFTHMQLLGRLKPTLQLFG